MLPTYTHILSSPPYVLVGRPAARGFGSQEAGGPGKGADRRRNRTYLQGLYGPYVDDADDAGIG